MSENRFSFNVQEMDTLQGCLDYCVDRCEAILNESTSAQITGTKFAVKLARRRIYELRQRLFPSPETVA